MKYYFIISNTMEGLHLMLGNEEYRNTIVDQLRNTGVDPMVIDRLVANTRPGPEVVSGLQAAHAELSLRSLYSLTELKDPVIRSNIFGLTYTVAEGEPAESGYPSRIYTTGFFIPPSLVLSQKDQVLSSINGEFGSIFGEIPSQMLPRYKISFEIVPIDVAAGQQSGPAVDQTQVLSIKTGGFIGKVEMTIYEP